MEPFDCIGGACTSPLAERQPGKGEEPLTGLLEAVGYCLAFEPPFAHEGAPALLDLCRRGGVDHVVIVGRALLMQPVGCMGEQVAMLVDGAALSRHVTPQGRQRLLQPGPAIDNQKPWLDQPALDEIVENDAPRLAGLATHVLYRQQHLLAVLTHAEHDQKNDFFGLTFEPDLKHGAVDNQADDLLLVMRAVVSSIPNAAYPA